MVEKDGEKKTRSSKSRRARGLPKSYRLQKKIPELNKPSNRLKNFNCGNLNCTTEKLSSLLMCQKGYASFAFYAIFAVFILAFIYVLWKIVSANTSRSGQGRRPEASPKVSPTSSAPTWSEEDEEELKKFFPTKAPFVTTSIDTDDKIGSNSNPTNLPDPSSSIRKTNSPTKELLQPTQSHVSQVRTSLPSLRLLRGSVFGEDAVTPLYGRRHQSAIIGEDFTPFPATSPFTSRWSPLSDRNWKINQQQRQERWSLPLNHQQQMPWAYQRRNPLQSLIRNSEMAGEFYGRGQYSQGYQESRKMQRQGVDAKHRSTTSEEDNQPSLHKKHEEKDKKRHHRSHTREHHHHNNSDKDEASEADEIRNTISRGGDDSNEQGEARRSRKHHDSQSWFKRHHKKIVDGQRVNRVDGRDEDLGNENDSIVETRHHHHHHHHHHDPHSDEQQLPQHYHHHRHPYEQKDEDGEQDYEGHHEQEHHLRLHRHHHHHHHHHHERHHYHHQNHHNYPTQVKHPSKVFPRYDENMSEQEESERHHHKHRKVRKHSLLKRKHSKAIQNIHHPKHQSHHHHHHHHPHPLHHHQTTPKRSHTTKHHHQHHKNPESPKILSTKNPALKHLHHILDYKHYIRFKQSHSLDEEVHGKWKGIRRKTKDCITIKTFSANGKVRLTRNPYLKKHLYTVLVCNVVQVRKRAVRHGSHTKYRTAQLCHKLYFVTKAIVRLSVGKKSLENENSLPEFKVEACRPSKNIHFEPVSFRGALPKEHRTRNDISQRSDIPKHKRKGHYHKTSKHGKKEHRHRGSSKDTKHHGVAKHNKTKKRKHNDRLSKSKKSGKRKLKSNKHVPKKHDKNNKKEIKVKSQEYEDVFFGKLLNVLTIASGNNRTMNTSSNPLLKLKGALQKMKKAKKEKEQQLNKKHDKSHSHESKKHSKKKTKTPDVSSPKYIQKLLEKILPSVVNNVKADLQGRQGETEDVVKEKASSTTATPTTTPPTTTKPTTKTTTTSPTTTATTATTTTTTTATTTTTTTTTTATTITTASTTTKPTTKTKGLEDELKDILPLLLKKAQLAKKRTTTQKPTTKPTTSSKSKEIKELLARLKLGGFDLGGLVDSKPTRDIKAAVNAMHTTVQQKLDELSEPVAFPQISPQHPSFPQQNNIDVMNQVTNNGAPVSMLGNDPFSKNILCFGDSLTKGYYNHGRGSHPYSIQLSRLLNANSQIRYKLVTSGKNGEMTHGSMTKRLPEVLGNSSHFDWVIILAGTNDVAHVKNFGDDDSFMNQLVSVWSPKIFKDIISLHEASYKYGARTVLLTIPESAYESWPQFRTLWIMRRKINQELREFARRSQGRTILCDIAMKMPRHSLSPQMQNVLWSDHLHLTPYGYDKMAGIIYQCMKPYL